MYICLCKGLKENQIKEIIEQESCKTFREVMRKTTAGTDCGSCCMDIKRITEETLEEDPRSSIF